MRPHVRFRLIAGPRRGGATTAEPKRGGRLLGRGRRAARCGLRGGLALAAALAAGVLSLAAEAGPAPASRALAADLLGSAGDAVRFDDRARDRIAITAPAYRLVLGKRGGALLSLVDRRSGRRLVSGSRGCLWRADPVGEGAPTGGCAFGQRLDYAWSRASSTLTLDYSDGAAAVVARVTIIARPSFLDLRLTIRNRTAPVLESVAFPADVLVETRAVRAGYAPTYLPGLRLGPGFFSRPGKLVRTYPSRWAFADYLSLDIGGRNVSLSSVNPLPSPLQPVALGFVRRAEGRICSGRFFCVTHSFLTWVETGASWRSPVVRLRLGASAQATILAYRSDNRIDRYPSLAAKLGRRGDILARAPLVKLDLVKEPVPFRDWRSILQRLPSPSLLHPVSFQPGGHDESFPDFLPPQGSLGTTEEFRGAVANARALGSLVMPYLNLSWWDDGSPTVGALPPPLTPADIAVRDESGVPLLERYGEHAGYVVSPYAPYVRERVARLLEEWRTEVPADCLFFDQLGARPWRRDLNPASPDPLAYYDGWLGLLAPYAPRCLMAEDGWDRLAASFAGFHGSVLMLAREHDEPDLLLGAGNWEPFPLAIWLLHDKVLLYQHDLAEQTLGADDEIVSWNLAFGFLFSVNADEASPRFRRDRLELAASLQRVLGPHYAGRRLDGYRAVAPDVTETRFGDLLVLRNRNAEQTRRVGGNDLAPSGYVARTDDRRVLAGAFAGLFNGVSLSPGTHHVIVERGLQSSEVRQPVGSDTRLAVDPPTAWRAGRGLRADAYAADGARIGEVPGSLRAGRFEFRYDGTLDGRRVALYRIGLAPDPARSVASFGGRR
ncbi:MAG: hypothetical protein H0V40_03495 [Actinobacteria bacterium]|nr:hypothetical protein [Actinomycetota bacterium]